MTPTRQTQGRGLALRLLALATAMLSILSRSLGLCMRGLAEQPLNVVA